jgi:hypothetical protein
MERISTLIRPLLRGRSIEKHGRALPHLGNPPGIVTLSVGCATMIPMSGLKVSNLIDMADLAVYKAKQADRNRVFNGCTASEPGGDGQEQVEGLAEVHSAGSAL